MTVAHWSALGLGVLIVLVAGIHLWSHLRGRRAQIRGPVRYQREVERSARERGRRT